MKRTKVVEKNGERYEVTLEVTKIINEAMYPQEVYDLIADNKMPSEEVLINTAKAHIIDPKDYSLTSNKVLGICADNGYGDSLMYCFNDKCFYRYLHDYDKFTKVPYSDIRKYPF